MKVTQMPPVHAANLVANSGDTAYGVDVIAIDKSINNNDCQHLLTQFSDICMHHLATIGFIHPRIAMKME